MLIWKASVLRRLGVQGLALCPGVVLLSGEVPPGATRDALIRHERIHHRQQLECLVLPFYALYLGMYLWLRMQGHGHWQAYHRIPFEREAYAHEADPDYLTRRPWYAWARLREAAV